MNTNKSSKQSKNSPITRFYTSVSHKEMSSLWMSWIQFHVFHIKYSPKALLLYVNICIRYGWWIALNTFAYHFQITTEWMYLPNSTSNLKLCAYFLLYVSVSSIFNGNICLLKVLGSISLRHTISNLNFPRSKNKFRWVEDCKVS